MSTPETYVDIQPKFWQTITIKDKALLYEHLANMISGGINIMKALDSFAEKMASPMIIAATQNLQFFLNSGDNLSTAMKKLPDFFEKYEVAIIEAGENAGKLQHSLSDLAHEIRVGYDLKSRIKSALTYPIIIIAFLVIAIIVVMVYVVPQLLPLFERDELELPLSTKVLVSSSNFISAHIGLIVLAGVLGIMGCIVFARSDY